LSSGDEANNNTTERTWASIKHDARAVFKTTLASDLHQNVPSHPRRSKQQREKKA
ncbi:hypothetical protein GBF38_005289, partial [Nibea albiflora]